MTPLEFPKTQQELMQRLAEVDEELKKLNHDLKFVQAKRRALQELCEHKKLHHDNDPRGPSSHCLDCGKYM